MTFIEYVVTPLNEVGNGVTGSFESSTLSEAGVRSLVAVRTWSYLGKASSVDDGVVAVYAWLIVVVGTYSFVGCFLSGCFQNE